MLQKIVVVLCILLPILFCVPGAQAQDTPEFRDFQRLSGDHSALFRGRVAERHDLIPANGHPFWSTREFKRGDIVVEGRPYYNVPINIDALAQRALVRLSNEVISIALEPAQVSSILLDGHRFIGVSPGDRTLQEGFYEVIGQGQELVYKLVTKTLDSAVDNVSGKDMGNYFDVSTRYYFRDREGRFSRFRDADGLIRHFKNQKKDLRKALRTARLEQSAGNFDQVCAFILEAAAQ